MAFLNIFKGKKGKLQKHSDKRDERKAEKIVGLPEKEAQKPKEAVAKKPSPSAVEPPSAGAKRKGEAKIAQRVLQFPRITEKATFLQENGQYVFRAFSTATKPEIKKSIEEVYGVDVLNVKVINVKRKSKRLGRSRGFQAGYKKAIVKIKKGQTIEVMPR